MPRKKKPARELTTDEALDRIFPKRVVTRVKKEAAKVNEQATKRKSK